MARTRERVRAMRPIFEAIAERIETQRQVTNFAFVTGKVERAEADEQDRAILRGRDIHGYDWDASIQYAQGWYAAHAGWAHRWPGSAGRRRSLAALREAYDKGFADGGGDRSDLFDQARRAFSAAAPHVQVDRAAETRRMLPSTWPRPTDGKRPCSWHRRAVILSEADFHHVDNKGQPSRSIGEIVQERSNGLATIIVVGAGGIAVDPRVPGVPVRQMTREQADALIQDPVQSSVLRNAFAGRDIDDLLVAVQGEELRVIDALVHTLPLCRTMERTGNSALQQRVHLGTWLARGVMPGENLGGGHIRWSGRTLALVGKLGEFVVRFGGPGPEGGHLLQVNLMDGSPAEGFVTCGNLRLAWQLPFSNKTHMRREMARALRAFGSATRLAAPQSPATAR